MSKQYDDSINYKLFCVDRFKEGVEYKQELEKAYELSKIAKELIKEHGDQTVFDSWVKYLKDNIHSRKDAWNYMMAFFDYDGHHLKVENPYPFLGLLLSKLELSLDRDPLNEDEDNMFETFDSIYIELLVKSGIVKQDDYF